MNLLSEYGTKCQNIVQNRNEFCVYLQKIKEQCEYEQLYLLKVFNPTAVIREGKLTHLQE